MIYLVNQNIFQYKVLRINNLVEEPQRSIESEQ